MLRLPLSSDHEVLIDDADQLIVAGFPWRVLKANNGLMYAHAWIRTAASCQSGISHR
jgi:hypothetical protein